MFSQETIDKVVVDCVVEAIRGRVSQLVRKHGKKKRGCAGVRFQPMRLYLGFERMNGLVKSMKEDHPTDTNLNRKLIKAVVKLGGDKK